MENLVGGIGDFPIVIGPWMYITAKKRKVSKYFSLVSFDLYFLKSFSFPNKNFSIGKEQKRFQIFFLRILLVSIF